MSILTYDRARAASAEVAPRRKAGRKSFWARAFERLIEAREHHAYAYLARHQALIDDLQGHALKAGSGRARR